jgi:hypothetical protein
MIGAVAALAATGLLAQASYPAALDRDAIAAWLPQAGLTAEQVVAVTPSAAIAIVRRTSNPGGRTALLLRALPLSPEAAARSGVLAWQMGLETDCRSGAVRLGATTGYDSRSATGDGVPLAPAETSWRAPKPGTPMENAWRAVCQAGFQPPLLAVRQQVAQAAAAPPRPPQPLSPSPPPARPRPVAPSASAFAQDVTAREPASPASRGRAAVQVVSSPRPEETRQVLARLQDRFASAAGLQTRVEPAQVRGRTVYRGVIAGFGSRDQAQAFCDTLKRQRQDCLAR